MVSADSDNQYSAMGCQITKDLTSLQRPLSSVPRWPLWRGSTVFKNTLEVLNYHVHLYVALLNLQFLIFFFRQKREKKICLEQGCNNRGVAEVRDIVATEKRSHQVARLVLWTFIHTFSGCLLNFRKIFSSGNVCWHRPGSHWMWHGFRWNFVLYMKLVAGQFACHNSHFS